MYNAIWRALPGPLALRIFLALILVGAVLAACYFLVFPWVDSLLVTQDGTLQP